MLVHFIQSAAVGFVNIVMKFTKEDYTWYFLVCDSILCNSVCELTLHLVLSQPWNLKSCSLRQGLPLSQFIGGG